MINASQKLLKGITISFISNIILKFDMDQFTINSPEDFAQHIQKRDEQIIQGAQDVAKRMAEIEVALSDFELLYSVMVDDKTKKQNEAWFKKHREKNWNQALKKAKGNELKALSIYGE